MWPSVFGPGWAWAVLVAMAFLCFVAGVLGFLFIVIGRPSREVVEPVDRLWRRFEERDLTREEFERLGRAGRLRLRIREVQK